eukprot:6720079-Pyramimonas_sp.AAC.1
MQRRSRAWQPSLGKAGRYRRARVPKALRQVYSTVISSRAVNVCMSSSCTDALTSYCSKYYRTDKCNNTLKSNIAAENFSLEKGDGSHPEFRRIPPDPDPTRSGSNPTRI